MSAGSRSRSRSRRKRGVASFDGPNTKEDHARVVHVVSLAAERVAEVHCTSLMSILDVKKQVQSASGVPVAEQRLLCGPSVLANCCNVCSLHMDSGCVLLTLVRMRGLQVLSGSKDGEVRFWRVNESEVTSAARFHGHRGDVCALEVDWPGQRVLSGAQGDETLWLWDLTAGETNAGSDNGSSSGAAHVALRGHTEAVYGMALDWDSERALSWSLDRTLRVWNLKTGCCEQVLQGHAEAVLDAEVGWNVNRAVSWGGEGSEQLLWVWDLSNGAAVGVLAVSHGTVEEVDADWDRLLALSFGRGRPPQLWDVARCEILLELACGPNDSRDIKVTIDWKSDTALTWSKTEGSLCLWGLRSCAEGVCSTLQRLEGGVGGKGSVLDIEVDWSQKVAISWGAHGIWFWDFAAKGCGSTCSAGSCSRLIGEHNGTVEGLDVDWDGLRALSWGDDGDLQLLSLQPPPLAEPSSRLSGHFGPVWQASACWDRSRAISWGFLERDLLVWDLDARQIQRRLQLGHAAPWSGGVDVDWSNGHALHWSHDDGRVLLWKLHSDDSGDLAPIQLAAHEAGVIAAVMQH